MKYKALIVDVDGTIVATGQSLPSIKVRDAIKKLKGKVNICLATGRPYNKIQDICKYLELSGPSIVSAGAQIVDVETGVYYYEYLISESLLYKIRHIVKNFENKKSFWIQDNGVDYSFDSQYKPDKPLVICVSGLRLDDAHELMRILSSIPEIFVTKVPSYREDEHDLIDLHITNNGATKQHAVLKIMEILHIKQDELIGIGDGHNDYPLLMACGFKVAMGNAVQELKDIADFVTSGVEDDGVAQVIDTLVN